MKQITHGRRGQAFLIADERTVKGKYAIAEQYLHSLCEEISLVF